METPDPVAAAKDARCQKRVAEVRNLISPELIGSCALSFDGEFVAISFKGHRQIFVCAADLDRGPKPDFIVFSGNFQDSNGSKRFRALEDALVCAGTMPMFHLNPRYFSTQAGYPMGDPRCNVDEMTKKTKLSLRSTAEAPAPAIQPGRAFDIPQPSSPKPIIE